MIEQKIDEEKYKTHLFHILKYFISFCEQHNLIYCCATGTMLGAVRHHGIIPWDDDIDVFMPRKDYEQLLTIASNMEGDGFKVISAKNSPSFATFAKIYCRDTTLWEIESIPFVYGVYIDIFPLDETSISKAEFINKYRYFRNLFRKYQLSQMRCSLKRIIAHIKEKDKKMAIKELFSIMFPTWLADYYRKKIIRFEADRSLERGDHLVSYYGDYWDREYFDKQWFESYIDMPFSDFTVKVPSGYHEYLTNVYGDYMQFPPVDKRVSHHYHYYLNMDKSMTLNEVRKELKTSNNDGEV